MIIIPANITQWLQLNDVTVFGLAKAMLRKVDDAFLAADVTERPSLRRAMTVMSDCIDNLQPHIAKTFRYVCDSPPDQLRRNKTPASTRSCLFYIDCYQALSPVNSRGHLNDRHCSDNGFLLCGAILMGE